MKHALFAVTTACLVVPCLPARAEQAATGHYMPGATASFIDAFPGQPGSLAVLNYFAFYDGEAGGSRRLPLGGLLSADLGATIYADTVAAVYQTPWSVLGGGYAVGAAVPFVWLEVSGQAQRIGPAGVLDPQVFKLDDSASGVGDIMLLPFMLGWTNVLPDLKVDTRLSVYAPTGDYEAGAPDNIGKNYWTFEPGIMASWFSTKYGTEVSLYAGADFNLENRDIDYTSGTALHVDLTVAQHLPVGKGFLGVGANGFYYQQVTGDSGSYARLGAFEGLTLGVGPVLSYIRPFREGKAQFLAEAKWLPELSVDNRMKGDYVWFKMGVVF